MKSSTSSWSQWKVVPNLWNWSFNKKPERYRFVSSLQKRNCWSFCSKLRSMWWYRYITNWFHLFWNITSFEIMFYHSYASWIIAYRRMWTNSVFIPSPISPHTFSSYNLFFLFFFSIFSTFQLTRNERKKQNQYRKIRRTWEPINTVLFISCTTLAFDMHICRNKSGRFVFIYIYCCLKEMRVAGQINGMTRQW